MRFSAQLGSNYFVDRLGPVCPFCGEPWSSTKTCGDPDPQYAGGWRAQNKRRKDKDWPEIAAAIVAALRGEGA
jgi:hypothetical protein